MPAFKIQENVIISSFVLRDEEKKKSIVTEELKLTEAGFRVNPKSYCSWFHRCWILDNFGTKEDWTKELYICTKYLEMDERNCNYFLFSVTDVQYSLILLTKIIINLISQFIVGIIGNM